MAVQFDRRAILLELADRIAELTMDWAGLQGDYKLGEMLIGDHRMNMATHVVNNAMGVKTPVIAYVQDGDALQLDAAKAGIDNLMRYHGQPNGIWSGDEHLNGTSSNFRHRTLCRRRIYVLAGRDDPPHWATRSTATCSNGSPTMRWPATFKPDMWAHQYDQQVNQVAATVARRNWTDNTDDVQYLRAGTPFRLLHGQHAPGLAQAGQEPGHGDLTMVWPVIAYASCVANAIIAGGVKVQVTVETQYPFDGKIRLKIGLSEPTSFPLLLRIPAWAGGATVDVDGEVLPTPDAATFYRIERSWTDGDTVTLDLPMKIRVERGHKDLISILRGPLLFGLRMGEQWQQIAAYPPRRLGGLSDLAMELRTAAG